ncbi:MAG TPA: DUF6456 domain-containing protein [Pseudolabrys sp.]|nr:DUF6456 domain-containing protein [Pseudolabrys sp.]
MKAFSRKTPAPAAGEPAIPEIDAFRAQHLTLEQRRVTTEFGPVNVTVDDAESPLAWLARRRGRDGRAMIAPHQFMAGERLRADFTRAHLMPRTTSNWESPMASGRGGGHRAGQFTDVMIASRQRVNQALETVGPEFSGLLLDVCCFLKGLEDIERERRWPARSGKVVLQLALDRLARHYGYAAQAKGRRDAPIRTWLAEGADFVVES